MVRKIFKIIFIALFAVILLLFGVLSLRNPETDKSNYENRNLAKFPSSGSLLKDSFPTEFDYWYSDHFPFRNVFLNTMMEFNIKVIKQSPIPEFVVIGKDNWLYYATNEIGVFRGTSRFSDDELQKILDELKSRRLFIESHGAKMIFAISPTKYSIYPEYVPSNLIRVNKVSRTDQLVKFLQGGGFPVTDLRKALLNNKSNDIPLFFKGDNHWNLNGAFYAYEALIAEMQKLLPSVGNSLSKSDYSITTIGVGEGNLSKMLFMNDGCGDSAYNYVRCTPNQTYTDTNEIYTPPKGFFAPDSYEERYSNGNKKSPKLLIIRDSFGYFPSQFLKEHFSETVCIFDAWEYRLNEDIILKEKPDIVLFIVLESTLHQLLLDK